jgi:hypothetical protein
MSVQTLQGRLLRLTAHIAQNSPKDGTVNDIFTALQDFAKNDEVRVECLEVSLTVNPVPRLPHIIAMAEQFVEAISLYKPQPEVVVKAPRAKRGRPATKH